MKALLLALLLISQPPKFLISGGIGITGYDYTSDEVNHSTYGIAFRVFFDYWIKDYLAFGVDSGYQSFKEKWSVMEDNSFFMPYAKIGTSVSDKTQLFLLIGYGFDWLEWREGDDHHDYKHSAFNFGAGFMRNFGNYLTGVVFNDIYVMNQDTCMDGCMENIHLSTFSVFFGFGK